MHTNFVVFALTKHNKQNNIGTTLCVPCKNKYVACQGIGCLGNVVRL